MVAAKDYTGQKFGRLTAIERIPERGKQTKYRFLCDCGREIIIAGQSALSGNTNSCGCLKSEVTIQQNHARLGSKHDHPPKEDITGVRSGRLVVTSYAGKNKHEKPTWNCLCDCGNTSVAIGTAIVNGRVLSCGCLQREAVGDIARTHGKSDSPEYGPWQAMWQRCTNPNNKFWNVYKDKTPPIEWREFAVFLKDMGPRPSPQHSIDRIKNDQPYGPGNCRWATPNEQARNKANTTMVEYDGRILSMADACDASGLDYIKIRNRKDHFKDVEIASNGLFKQVPKHDNTNIL